MKQEFLTRGAQLVARMTLAEKASLCSGMDFWHTKGVERLGLPSVMVTDGPHGLRKQAESADHLGINKSVPATCFPTASATACSFDRALMREIGTALGAECRQEGVAVLLGPGVNIKRSPLCGRNFEYISEDPCLTGETAAALISGVQSQNVGVSLKHYALNSQEKARMSGDSVVDERALREIYLAGFETAVKKAAPWTVMCSYNKINGTHASDNKKLLTDILRDEWGFTGAVMTDWGAIHDRVTGIRAGLDLEMPASGGVTDLEIVAAVRAGELKEALVDRCAARVAAIALQVAENATTPYDSAAHHELARRAARESAVLLKNDGALPAARSAKIAVVGQFAKFPRYQGSGSSKINPTKMTTVADALDRAEIRYTYAEGYDLINPAPDAQRIAQAVLAAQEADVVLAFVGLPDSYESEGFDRTHLDLPQSHNALMEALTAAHRNVVAVLFTGSAVVLPWQDRAEGILVMHLPGQAHGDAVRDLLFGDWSPCGKLAETWPLAIEDTPCFRHFGKGGLVEYRESLYVGYRYYDKAKLPVAYPFGHGLSYTTFSYSDLSLDHDVLSEDDTLTATLTVENTGGQAGCEIVQLYVAPPETTLFKPVRELRDYAKLRLAPGEQKTISFRLDRRAFSYYHAKQGCWAIEDGVYSIEARPSSQAPGLSAPVRLETVHRLPLPDLRAAAPAYFAPSRQDFPTGQFEALLGRPCPVASAVRPFTLDSTLTDLNTCPPGQALAGQLGAMMGQMAAQMGGGEDMNAMMEAMLGDLPLRSMVMLSQGALSLDQVKEWVAQINQAE